MAVVTSAGPNIIVLNSGLFSFNNPYFVWGWINTSSIAADQNVIVPYVNSGAYDGIGIHSSTGIIYLYSNTTSINSSIAIATNRPYFVAIVRESATLLRMYVDNVLAATNTDNIAGRAASNQLNFGSWGNGADGYYDQFVGRYWNWMAGTRIPTINEMILQRSMTAPITRTGLYGWWPFGPGATDRLRDLSGNGHTLTNVGTPTDTNSLQPGWGLPALAYYPLPAASGLTGAGSTSSNLSNNGTGQINLQGAGSSALNESNVGAGQTALQAAGSTAMAETNNGGGRITLSGAGSAALQEVNTGAGIVTLSGAGSSALNESNTGSGLLSLQGAGSAALNETNSGSGQLSLLGAGSAVLNETNTGTGQLGGSLNGAGSTVMALNANGSGQTALQGAGSTTLQESNIGTGQIKLQGAGSATLQKSNAGAGILSLQGSGNANVTETNTGSGQIGSALSGNGATSSSLNTAGSGHLDLYGGGQTADVLSSIGTGLAGDPASGFVMARNRYAAAGKRAYRPAGKVPYKA